MEERFIDSLNGNNTYGHPFLEVPLFRYEAGSNSKKRTISHRGPIVLFLFLCTHFISRNRFWFYAMLWLSHSIPRFMKRARKRPASSDPSGRPFLWSSSHLCYNSLVVMVPTLGNHDYPRMRGRQPPLMRHWCTFSITSSSCQSNQKPQGLQALGFL